MASIIAMYVEEAMKMPSIWQWPEAQDYVPDPSKFDPPSHFSKVAATTLPIQRGRTRLLDIGCARGIVGLYSLVVHGAVHVTFNDIETAGIFETSRNADLLIKRGLIRADQIRFVQPCSFEQLSARLVMDHDLIAFNPPQYPMELADPQRLKEIQSDPLKSHYRLGGPDGLDLARKFLGWFSSSKASSTKAAILLSGFLSWSKINAAIQMAGLTIETVTSVRVPLRADFHIRAVDFSAHDSELRNRSLERSRDGWTKELHQLILAA